MEESCSTWQWLSTPPGMTSLPVASMTFFPARPGLISTIFSPWMPTSARSVFSAVTTVPPRMTRSRGMARFSYNSTSSKQVTMGGGGYGAGATEAADPAAAVVLPLGRTAVLGAGAHHRRPDADSARLAEADDGRWRHRADGAGEARHRARGAARRGAHHARDSRRPVHRARSLHPLLGRRGDDRDVRDRLPPSAEIRLDRPRLRVPALLGPRHARHRVARRRAVLARPLDRSRALSGSPRGVCYNARLAPVAQLDRVPGYEPGGRGFKSCRARQFTHESGLQRCSPLSFSTHPLTKLNRAVRLVDL